MKLTNQRKILSCLVAGSFLLSSASFANVEKTLRWNYDSYGRLTTEQVGNQETVSYSEFSISDVPKKLTYNESVIVDNIILNNDGTSQNVVYGGDKTAQADFTYSDFSSPLTSVLNVNGQLAFSEIDMQYDSRGYLNSLKKRYQNSDIDYIYDYDAMGKLTTFGVDNSTVNYGYDVRGNLVSKTGFKANGLEITPLATQSYNTKYQNTAWTYDGDGNLIEDDEFTYKYNDANRLTLVINKNSDEWVAHYIYDSSGNRVRTMTQETTTYFYRNAAGNVVKEEVFDNVTGELVRSERHINAGGINIASVSQQGDQSEEIEYQFNGRLGSQSVRWTDAGEVITQDYSPFGEQMNKDSLHSGTYGFTQHEDDLETDSTYMKARHYRASFGRMNRPDPARDFNVLNASSMNLYAYVGNNPVNAWDPTGLQTDKKNSQGKGAQERAEDAYCESSGGKSSKCKDSSGGIEEFIMSVDGINSKGFYYSVEFDNDVSRSGYVKSLDELKSALTSDDGSAIKNFEFGAHHYKGTAGGLNSYFSAGKEGEFTISDSEFYHMVTGLTFSDSSSICIQSCHAESVAPAIYETLKENVSVASTEYGSNFNISGTPSGIELKMLFKVTNFLHGIIHPSESCTNRGCIVAGRSVNRISITRQEYLANLKARQPLRWR